MVMSTAAALGSAGIGALGSLGSVGLGILSANHQSGKEFGRQLYAMERQAELNYWYGRRNAKNSPSWNREGLERAGYNPMLAVQNATSGTNSSWASPNSAPTDQATDAITNGIRNGTDMAQLAINQQQTDSNVRLNNANTRKSISEAVNNEIHSKYLHSREEKELGKIGAETDKLIRETSYYDQLAENMEAERRLQEMGINVQKYGIDKSYNASTYASNINERNNIRSNRTIRGREVKHFGFGTGIENYYGAHNRDNDWYYDYLK